MAAPDSEMNRMQQDAIRRMREMQTRAMQAQSASQTEARTHSDRPQARQNAAAARSPSTAPHTAARNEPRVQNRQQEPVQRQNTPHTPQGVVHSTRVEPARNETRRVQPEPKPEPHRPPPAPRAVPAAPEKHAKPLTEFFEMLFKDSDRTLILALLLVLHEEKADPALLFALMYIAL